MPVQLRQHPEGLTAAELAERSLEDKAAVSRAVARLEELGLVELPEEGGKAPLPGQAPSDGGRTGRRRADDR